MTEAEPLRFEVRVKPGARRVHLGGTWGDHDALVIAVTERAADGAANLAVLDLLSKALKVRKHKLRIVQGMRHRSKLIEIADPPRHAAMRLERWRTLGNERQQPSR